MIQNPVLIVGTERSGSNLLRLLLNELSEIAVPHPPHLMRDLGPVAHRYGDLRVDKNFKRLIRDAIKLVDLHFAPWPIRPSAEEIFKRAAKRTIYSVYAEIYEQYRASMGKERWGCKSTFMIHHVSEVLRHHKKPQFIHLVRDPRDVAVSARKSVFCHYHPFFVADLWAREQAVGLEWAEKLGEEAWFTLRYEDLIARPTVELRKLCKFLGARYTASMLRFFEKPAARQLAGLSRSWENVGQPVLKKNSGKYMGELSVREIALIESVAGDVMREFGYKTQTESDETLRDPSVLQAFRYRMSENVAMLREEAKAALKDRNAVSRLRKKAFLLRLQLRGSL